MVFTKKIIKVRNGIYKSIYHGNYNNEEIRAKFYTQEEKIINFLNKNKNKVYHKDVIMKNIGIKPASIAVLLCNLKKENKIIHVSVGHYRSAK